MSVPLRLLESRQLSDGAKVLAMVILALADADGVCRQRFSVLATAAGTTERTARRRALELDRGGWFSREKSASGLQGLRPVYGRWARPPDKNTAGGSPPTGTEVATPPANLVPVAGKGLGWGDGELGIVSLLAQGLTAIEETAASFHRHVGLMLSNMGCDVHREVEVAVEGERGARVDLMAKGPTGWIALELDRKSPRKNSIRKLRRLNALRVVLLREPGGEFEWPEDIHAVVVAGQAARWRLGVGAGGWSPVSSIPDGAQVWAEGQRDDGRCSNGSSSDGPGAHGGTGGQGRGRGEEADSRLDGTEQRRARGQTGARPGPWGGGGLHRGGEVHGGDRRRDDGDPAGEGVRGGQESGQVIPPLPGGAPREGMEGRDDGNTKQNSETALSRTGHLFAQGEGGAPWLGDAQAPRVARAPVLTSPTAEPRPRKGEPTRDELDDVARVLEALHSAKGRAGMPVGPKAGKPGTGQGKAILKRLRELRDDGEADPVPLLCAVMHAKVERDAQSDEPERASGRWANGVTICRDAWWDANLAAGRNYMSGGARRKAREDIGPYVPRGEYA